MNQMIRGAIESSGNNLRLNDCRIDLSCQLVPTQGGTGVAKPLSRQPAVRNYRLAARTDAKGSFALRIPDGFRLTDSPAEVTVFSPAGRQIGEKTISPKNFDSSVSIEVRTEDLVPIDLGKPAAASEPATRRIRGRLADPAGRRIPAGLQVILLARRADSQPAGPAEIPLLVARTDATGTFIGTVTSGRFASASVVVAGLDTPVAIALDDGRIPREFIILVALSDSGTDDDKDCGCGGTAVPRTPSQADIEASPETYSADLGTGRCIRFDAPNRAIEEFDFFTVVRTTEPAIVGVDPFGQDSGGGPASAGSLAALQLAVDNATAEEATARAQMATIEAAGTQARADVAVAQQILTAINEVRGYLETMLRDNLGKAKEQVINSIAGGLAAHTSVGAATARAIAEMYAAATSATVAAKDTWKDTQKAIALWGEGLTLAQSRKQLAAAAAAEATTALAAALDRVRRAGEAVRAAEDALAARRREIEEAEARRNQRESGKTGGRGKLNAANPVDWDETPHFYQSAEIAHGHLLHFKQVWQSDGYSLGDLLYSVPLAPGQKRLVSIIDWERRESAEQQQSLAVGEQLTSLINRDRDLGEVVRGTLTESSRGGSRSTSAGVGIGTGGAANGSYQGINFGALLGVSGGYGEANSSAWQDSARNVAADSMQTLRDRTMQSASAIRDQRATVVRAVRQGEAVRATTEVIANHNHCHALTVQYFEVLRHLKLTQELAGVQECLFVPLPMTRFDLEKTLRWRQELRNYLSRPGLAAGFDAARRVLNAWSDEETPTQRYGDEFVESLAGELQLTVIIPLPPFPERPQPRPEETAEQAAKAMAEAVNPTTGVLGILLAVATGGASLVAGAAVDATIAAGSAAAKGARALADEYYHVDPQERYARFHREVVPGVVAAFVDNLELEIVTDSGTVPVPEVDFTLASEYQAGVPLAVSLRAGLQQRVQRAQIRRLVIRSRSGLPASFRAIVNSAQLRYRTPSFEHVLVDDRRVNDDLDPPRVVPVFNGFDLEIRAVGIGKGVTLFAPMDNWEQRNPRKEDRRLTAELIDHLNDNFEYYHHAIWWAMDPNRRYMLLDGYHAPNSGNRSVASVVDNRLIGIVGNSLVLPVAPGIRLDPRFAGETQDDLFDHYRPDPLPATRISLPTRGVFAEAIMGNCNSCEEIDDSRFWRWEESPIDEPPAIGTTSTDSRRSEVGSLAPTTLANPIVAIQNVPAASDSAGIKAALDALGKQSFADITGLAGTQQNAAAAYQQALDTAYKFGKEASTLAQQAAMLNSLDKSMSAIDKAEAAGKIDAAKAKELRATALDKIVGTASTDDSDPAGVKKRLDVISDAVKSDSISTTDGREHSNAVLKNLSGSGAGSESDQAISDIIKKVSPDGASVVKAETADGASIEVEQAGADWAGEAGGIYGFLRSVLGAYPTSSNPRPGVQRAHSMLTEFAKRRTTSAWPSLDRIKVAQDLAKLVNRPDTLNQGRLELCGPAVFINAWLHAEPDSVVSFAISLFEKGSAAIGNLMITPGRDLMHQDYAKIKINVPQGAWMMMSALRDSENEFVDYEGTPSEDISAGTGDDEVIKWLDATRTFKPTQYKTSMTIADVAKLEPSDLTQVILGVNDLFCYPDKPLGLINRPNHLVALRAKIQRYPQMDPALVRYEIWTWGETDMLITEEERFMKLLEGAIVVERKPY